MGATEKRCSKSVISAQFTVVGPLSRPERWCRNLHPQDKVPHRASHLLTGKITGKLRELSPFDKAIFTITLDSFDILSKTSSGMNREAQCREQASVSEDQGNNRRALMPQSPFCRSSLSQAAIPFVLGGIPN